MFNRLRMIAALAGAAIIVSLAGCSGTRIHTTAKNSQPEPAPTHVDSSVAPATHSTEPESPDSVADDETLDEDPDALLPVAAKTGAMPTEPALVNAVNELKQNSELRSASRKSIQTEPSKNEKMATMGAFIDLLLDAVNDNDRHAKAGISKTLWDIWEMFTYADRTKDAMIYSIGFEGQSDSDLVVRRWLEVYHSYKTDD